VLAVGLALATGLVRLPFNYAWGALHEAKPDSAATRFMAGMMNAWVEASEGSKHHFIGALKRLGLIEAMNDKKKIGELPERFGGGTTAYHRPTLKAALAFGAARLLQALWLMAIPLLTVIPVIPAYAVHKGVQRARAPTPDPKDGRRSPDDPDRLY